MTIKLLDQLHFVELLLGCFTIANKEESCRAVEITSNVILDQDQVQAIYFDIRSDQGKLFW